MRRDGKTGGQAKTRVPRVAKKTTAPSTVAAKAPPAKVVPVRPKQPSFTTTDTGNIERMHHHYGRDIRYVTSWQQYLTWSGSVWKRDAGGTMIRIAKQTVATIKDDAKALLNAKDEKSQKQGKALMSWWRQSESMTRRDAMLRGIRGERGVEIHHDALDSHPWLFGVENGVIDLKTGKLLPNDRKYLLTMRTKVRFDPNAKAPKWEAFLAHVLPDKEVREFMQRFVGYALTGSVTERMFCVLFGGGRNGKSVFLKTLQYVMGPYGVSTAPGLLMTKQGESHPTEVADLCGTRLAVTSEVRKGKSFDEELVKRLTGNDVLKARRMREDFWDFEPTFKLMLAANHKPQVRDDSDSFWDRIALVPFTTRIDPKKMDKQLQEKLRGELPGILAWAVRGCLAWQKDGLERPAAIKAAVKDYRDNEDTMGKFFEEECTFGKGYATATAALTARVKEWCAANNLVYTFKEKDMSEKLMANGCERVFMGPKTARARGWRGVALLVRSVNGDKAPPVQAVGKVSKTKRDADEPEPEVEPASVPKAEVAPSKPARPAAKPISMVDRIRTSKPTS